MWPVLAEGYISNSSQYYFKCQKRHTHTCIYFTQLYFSRPVGYFASCNIAASEFQPVGLLMGLTLKAMPPSGSLIHSGKAPIKFPTSRKAMFNLNYPPELRKAVAILHLGDLEYGGTESVHLVSKQIMQAHDIFLFKSQQTSSALLFFLWHFTSQPLMRKRVSTCFFHSLYSTFALRCPVDGGHIRTNDSCTCLFKITAKQQSKARQRTAKTPVTPTSTSLAAPRLPIGFVPRVWRLTPHTSVPDEGTNLIPGTGMSHLADEEEMRSPAVRESRGRSARKRSTCTQVLHSSPLCHSLL